MIGDYRDHWDEVLNYFESDGRFGDVDFYDCSDDSTPPVGVFSCYDVIVAGGTASYREPVIFGDRLADYVDQGGCVVVETGKLMNWPWSGGIGGRWHDDGYCPYYSENPGGLEGDEDLIIDEPGHAIFDGVSGLWDSLYRVDTILRSGAVELAHFPDSGGVAVNAWENVVGLNYMCGAHNWTGDGYLILANAACYLAAHSDVREMSWGQIKAEFE
ncbi:MAG: hypothetical protein NTW26_06100 [bacterium]|nr:hypothetical protein [bacterium]